MTDRVHIPFVVLCASLAVACLAGCGRQTVTGPGPYQWSSTSGPSGTIVWSLVARGSDVFAGTTIGIFRSSDQGASWTPVFNGRFVFCLAQSDHDLLAGTGGGVVFHSSDNGGTWTPMNGLPAAIRSLAVSGASLFAGTDGHGIFRSTGLGAWVPCSQGLSDSTVVALAVSGTTLFAGTHDGIFRSTDNGDHWTAVRAQAWVEALAVSGTILVASTWDGMLRSTDAGATWAAVTGLPSAHSSFYSLAVTRTSLFGTGYAEVFRSDDLGASWHAVGHGLPRSVVTGLAVGGSTLFAGTGDYGVWQFPLNRTGLLGGR